LHREALPAEEEEEEEGAPDGRAERQRLPTPTEEQKDSTEVGAFAREPTGARSAS